MNVGRGTYTVINVGGQGIGGIAGVPPNAQGMPPAWGGYVTVDDVDAAIAL
jgi:predicted enzyme related to lactoylglutathione lyase